jgi:regulatory protein
MRNKPRSGGVQPTNAFAYALRRLALRDHSERELVGALSRKTFTPEEIGLVIERLRRERLLDDSRYATRHASARIGGRGMGRNRVRAELQRRGIARDTVEAGIAEALRDVSEAESLDAVARRYWGQHARISPDARFRRLFAFLLRRGFAAALVSQRLRGLWPEWKQALDDLEPTDHLQNEDYPRNARGD